MIKTSLFAADEREAKLDKLGDILQAISGIVEFAGLVAQLDAAAPRPGREWGGRPPFPTELMVRVLVLQKLYGLSDEQVAYQILVRKTSQCFVGLEDSSHVPGRTTVWEFRERLVGAGAETVLFDAIDGELNRHGYLARSGLRVDASLATAPKQHLTRRRGPSLNRTPCRSTGRPSSEGKRTWMPPGRKSTASPISATN